MFFYTLYGFPPQMLKQRELVELGPAIGSCRTQLPQNLTAGAWKCIIGVNFCMTANEKIKKYITK